jgi:hypothetical protein
MANTENFPNTGKKKTRQRRYDRCYTELLRLLTKHRFRFTVEPLKEPKMFEDKEGKWNKRKHEYEYTTYPLDTRIAIDDGNPKKQIAVYTAPNLDALVDPGADTGEFMDAQEVTVWAYNELRDKEVEYGTL